jgi:hypothetical protein
MGLEILIDNIHRRDETLGAQRAEMVNALIVAVQAELDAARQLQLARDRWALRAAAFHRYRLAIRPPMELLTTLKPSLESIKSLSGTSPGALSALQQTVDKILGDIAAIAPPTELLAAHALLVSAAHLARNAGQIRREATLAADIARAWDASSAAAGALMLAARARSDIQALLLPPQLLR